MRTCLFCDQKAKTLEHVWPAWLNESLGVSSPSRVEAWLGPEAERKEWHDAPIQIRAVCASCNNGWMSRLEGKARPLIGAR